ncbi:MAG: ribonuclease Z [Dorea sp.]|nr:ribonuclease Z [Dorea sp.]
MVVIVCLDDDNGMMFNRRRQSKDRAVKERIGQISSGKRLWMNSYTYKLYGGLCGTEIIEAEDFLERAGSGELCLVETESLAGVEAKIEKVVLFRWNRKYPADFWFDLALSEWKREAVREFSGTSHEKITEEEYCKKGTRYQDEE